MIYYSRCNFSAPRGASIHCFDLVYPQREKRAWDAMVTRISLSWGLCKAEPPLNPHVARTARDAAEITAHATNPRRPCGEMLPRAH